MQQYGWWLGNYGLRIQLRLPHAGGRGEAVRQYGTALHCIGTAHNQHSLHCNCKQHCLQHNLHSWHAGSQSIMSLLNLLNLAATPTVCVHCCRRLRAACCQGALVRHLLPVHSHWFRGRLHLWGARVCCTGLACRLLHRECGDPAVCRVCVCEQAAAPDRQQGDRAR